MTLSASISFELTDFSFVNNIITGGFLVFTDSVRMMLSPSDWSS